MKQQHFEDLYGSDWQAFERWLAAASQRRRRRRTNSPTAGATDVLEDDEIPRVYRRVCHHLALCRARNYSPALEARLNRLALDGHRLLYATGAGANPGFARFFARDFPACVRRNWAYVAFMAALFYLPLIGLVVAIAHSPSLVYTVLPPDQVAGFESMYDPDAKRIGSRDSGDDFMMFGFYILNNIGIGFSSFASGLALCVGPLYVTVSNGVQIGAVMGHLSANGFGETLWSFVAGHGALELNALVLAGAAGLKLGFSVICPGRRRRGESLRVAAADAMPMVFGFTAMLLGAAFIEAFWSSTTWPGATLKYIVGGVMWILVMAYFLLAGRSRGY